MILSTIFIFAVSAVVFGHVAEPPACYGTLKISHTLYQTEWLLPDGFSSTMLPSPKKPNVALNPSVQASHPSADQDRSGDWNQDDAWLPSYHESDNHKHVG